MVNVLFNYKTRCRKIGLFVDVVIENVAVDNKQALHS